MTPATRFSYFFLVAVIVLAAATHLATPLITVLFSYFALRNLHFGKRKWLALLLFFVLIGIVVAVSLFVNPRIEKSSNKPKSPNLFTATTDEIKIRFRLFYQSFEIVMGAQIRISAINTLLTAVFVLVVSLKYGTFVVGLTFLCGLLPIVGNLLSNAVIVGIAVTMSPRLAIVALIFLVAVHKLEYFLNSKIIGDRIKNPVWLTLLALIVGERFMGIPGMILAPVVLNYIKVEASQLPPPDAVPVNERD